MDGNAKRSVLDRRGCAKWLRQQAELLDEQSMATPADVACCVEAAIGAYHHYHSGPRHSGSSGSSIAGGIRDSDPDLEQMLSDSRNRWRTEQRRLQEEQVPTLPRADTSPPSTHNVMEALEAVRIRDREEREAAARNLDLAPFRGHRLASAERAVAEVEALCVGSMSDCGLSLVQLEGVLAQWHEGRFVRWLRTRRAALTGALTSEGALTKWPHSVDRISLSELSEQVRWWWDEVMPSFTGSVSRSVHSQSMPLSQSLSWSVRQCHTHSRSLAH